MSKPTYSTVTSTLIASGLRSNATTRTEAGLRLCRFFSSHDKVRPESMMSSTMSTCCPAISRSRSLRIRTTPSEVGHKHDRTLEHPDQQRLPVGIVLVDLFGELTDLDRYLVGGHDDRVDIGVEHGRHSYPLWECGGIRHSLPDTRVTPNPPGRSTRACPCQRATSPSSSARWVAVSAGTPARVAQRRNTRERMAWECAAKLVASSSSPSAGR